MFVLPMRELEHAELLMGLLLNVYQGVDRMIGSFFALATTDRTTNTTPRALTSRLITWATAKKQAAPRVTLCPYRTESPIGKQSKSAGNSSVIAQAMQRSRRWKANSRMVINEYDAPEYRYCCPTPHSRARGRRMADAATAILETQTAFRAGIRLNRIRISQPERGGGRTAERAKRVARLKIVPRALADAAFTPIQTTAIGT
jgi:hypothetical protein